MANRRNFLAAAGIGLAAGPGLGAAQGAEGPQGGRDLYELRHYRVADESQRAGLDAFLRDAAIPAMNRIGIAPVGVFYPEKDVSPVYVLLRHRSMESVASSAQKLAADAEYLRLGAAFLDAPAEKPAFQRVETSLFLAFPGMPAIEQPVKGPGRIFQLRTYESPSVKTGRKKIEMFDEAGEIAIFRRVGLHPVFFAEAIAGPKMPNLTYMLGFSGREELDANWATFRTDPEWKRLSGMPEYADKAILSGITNILLKPAEYSQV
jgi:hypothetical protein